MRNTVKNWSRWVLFLFLAASGRASHSQDPVNALAQVRGAQNHYANTLLSLRTHVTQTVTYTPLYRIYINDPQGTVPLHSEMQADWISKGGKTVDRQQRVTSKGETSVITEIWDGRRGYSLVSQQQGAGGITYGSASVRFSRGIEWNPLEMGYQYHARPLSEIIGGIGTTLTGISSDPSLGPLWIVKSPFRREGHSGVYRFWFAPKYGLMAVRSEETTQIDPTHAVQITAEATDIVRHGSVFLADAGIVQKKVLSDTNGGLEYTMGLLFTDTQINSVPDSMFKLHVPIGSHIDDVDAHTRFALTASGRWVKVRSPYDMKPTPSPQIIAARANPFAILFLISTVTTVVLLVIRQRSRRPSVS